MLRQRPFLNHFEKNTILQRYFPSELDTPIELWPRQRLQQYHSDALAYILQYAYEHNGHYREKFERANVRPSDFRELDDLKRFPFTIKDELRGDPWRFLAVPRREICQVHVSTGTTSKNLGDHIYRLLSWNDIYVSELATRSFVSPISPSRPGDVVAIALPYEMSSAGVAMHKTYQFAAKAIAVNFGKGGYYSHPLKTVLAMRDLNARIIVTSPSYAVALHDAALAAGMDLREVVQPKLLWLTGEGCSDALRDRISRLWNCVSLRYYGSLECGAIGVECICGAGFHLFDAHVYVEVVDPVSGRPLPEGMTGEVCATVLNKVGAPLIRYRTGDLGYLDQSPCACCLSAPRLFLRGRREGQIQLKYGSYSPVFLEHVLLSLPEVGNSYQFIIRDQTLSVRAELARGVTFDAALAEKVRRRLECYVGNVEKVELVEKLEGSGGKAIRVVWN